MLTPSAEDRARDVLKAMNPISYNGCNYGSWVEIVAAALAEREAVASKAFITTLYARLHLSMGFGFATGNSDYWQGWRDALGAFEAAIRGDIPPGNEAAWAYSQAFAAAIRARSEATL